MTSAPHLLTRRAFSAIAASGLASTSTAGDRDLHAHWLRGQFVQDLSRSYEYQLIGLDMEDINAVFQELRTPLLRVGVAAGPDRAARAAQAALPMQGPPRQHALVIIVFPPGEGRLREYKTVFDFTRARLDPSTFIIFGACLDEHLAPGTARVSALVG